VTEEFCTKPQADWLYLADCLAQLSRYRQLFDLAQEEFYLDDPARLRRSATLLEAYDVMTEPVLKALEDYVSANRT
jgi:hypothetical protein